MERISERINWVDYCKAFAIFGVVLLHVHCDSVTTQLIDGFIMPLFFFISGWLFSYERNPKYSHFAYKRFRQLVIPYFWIGIISFLCWYFVLRHFGGNEHDGVEWHKPLIGLFAGIPKLVTANTPLWSLLAFFIVEIIYYPIGEKLRKGWIITLIFLVLLSGAYFIFPDYLESWPMMLGPSLGGLLFYSLGHQCRKIKWIGKYLLSPYSLVIWVAMLIYSSLENDRVDFYICQYNNFPLFLLSSISGTAIIIIISKLISKSLGSLKLIRFISETTLIVCGFHLLVFSLVKGVAYFLFGMDPDSLTDGLLHGILFALVSFFITLIICYIIRRYFRPLIDK